jgi:ATP-binding cassette subfamily B protein
MARNRYFEDEQLHGDAGSILWRLLKYLKPYRMRMVGAVLLMFISAIAIQIGPFLVKIAVDQHMRHDNYMGIIRLSAFYLFLLLVSSLAMRYRLLIAVRTGNQVIESLREEVFSHVNRLSFDFFDERPAGKIITRIMNNVDRLQQLIKHGVVNIIGDLFRLFIIFLFMLVISWRLTIIAALLTPVLWLVVIRLRKAIKERWEFYYDKNANLNAYLHESILGIKITQSFVREETNSEIMQGQLDENYDSWMRATRASSLLFPIVLVFNAIAIALVYLTGYHFLKHDMVTLGVLISFSQYIWMVTEPIVNLSTFYNEAQVAIAAAQRVFAILDTEPSIQDDPKAYELPKIQGNVTFRNVHFAYESDHPVLKNINLQIQAGETIALVGETGAGKSTIINLLTRFYDLEEGEILLDGHNIKEVTVSSLRKQVGVMMQDSFIFSGSIKDNIRYGKLDATEEEIKRAAEAVHADRFIMQQPEGYDTEVNEGGNRLSAGQKQLIAFARILLYDPQILILDEATASVDTQTERMLQQAIERVLSDRTSFVVAHRLSTIRHADRILVIEEGEIIESGSHEQLLIRHGKYHELHQKQCANLL